MLIRNLILAAAAVWAAPLFARETAPAEAADQVVVERHVTLRENAARDAGILDFPAIGSRLRVLDRGARVDGYYHVEDGEGRRGWIYKSFVTRQAEADQAFQALVGAGPMAVHYINVDQGAAALVEFPCGAILIDAGGRQNSDGDHLVAYLDAFFKRRPELKNTIAALFMTHHHIDHNRHLQKVVERYRINGYIHNGVPATKPADVPANWMTNHIAAASPKIAQLAVSQMMAEAAGAKGYRDPIVDPLACAVDPDIHVLTGGRSVNPGWNAEEYGDANNHSLVIRIAYGASSFLFSGDLENPGIEELLKRENVRSQLNADVWLVSHHGADNGTTAELLQAITPKVAIISVGERSAGAMWTAAAHGHPRRTALEFLQAHVSSAAPVRTVYVADGQRSYSKMDLSRAIYATGWDGDITLSAAADGKITVFPGE